VCEDVQIYNTKKHANDVRSCGAGKESGVITLDLSVRIVQVYDFASIICQS